LLVQDLLHRRDTRGVAADTALRRRFLAESPWLTAKSLEIRMSETTLSFGDRVRHSHRPEWGIGTVVKVEEVPLNGHHTQRVSIRFPNAGMKVLVARHAELQRVTDNGGPLADSDAPSARAWDKLHDDNWLSPVAQRKMLEALISLPQEVRDAFNSIQKRLHLTLRLYRFDKSGKGLMDWAVAQTGLDDPLSRFTRQELEQHFARFATERDAHLQRLIAEARNELAVINAALEHTPPAALEAVRRVTGWR
jgi:hypothetical protein